MSAAARTGARRGRIALLSLLACGAFLGTAASPASAALPNTLNTATGCPSQTSWLVTCTTGGQTAKGANIMRVTVWASHDLDKSLASLLTDDDWDGSSFDTRGVTAQRPTIDGGYPRSRANLTWNHDTGGTGMSCRGFPFYDGTRATSDKVLRLQARDSGGQTESGTTDSIVRFVGNSGCTGPEDYPFLYDIASGNFGDQVTPGSSVTVTYNGDDPDSGSNEDFEGVRWRLRNLRTGAVSGETTDCDSNGDNNTKSTTANIPDRGAWVIEAELRNANDCSQNDRNDWWWALGTVDANSSGAPSLSLDSATTMDGGVVRPNVGSDWTVRAQGLVDPDSADGGGAQILEWDLDANAGNGVDGYEETNYAGFGDVLDVGDASGTDATQRNVDSSGQAPGLYTVRARVTDNGAADAADSIRRRSGAVSLQYRVDAPPVVNNQTINTDTGAANVPVNLAASDSDGDALAYTITDPPDHGSLSGGTTDDPTYTPAAGYAGTDSFTVQVSDPYGGTDTAVISFNVRPDTSILTNPPDPSTSTNAAFTFDSNGGPVSFQCQIDGGGFSSCASPKSYTGLGQGSHTFQVRAVATTGGVPDPSPASYTWSIDSIPPDTQIDSAPADPSNSAAASFDFSGSGGPASFECRLDGLPAGWAACSSPQGYAGLGDGSHTFEVRAKDAAGNVDPTPATHTWLVDTVAPTTTLNTFPADPTNSTSASFGFVADEPGSFECELDGGGFSSCASPKTYTGLSDGSHTFKVRATDGAGNTGNTVTKTWTIDTDEPETTINANPPALTNNPNASFDFDSDESPNVSFQCRLDSSDPGDWQACTSPQAYNLLHGSHTFEVRATDAAGNTDSTPASYTWQIDLQAPGTAIDDNTAPGNAHPLHRTTSGDAQLDFISFDPSVTQFECRLDSTLEADFQPCSSPKLYSGLPDGPHMFQVRARDDAGNVDATPATWNWEVYTGLPQTIIDSNPPNPSDSQDASFSFHSSIPDSTFECSLDGSAPAPCASPQAYTGLSEAEHTFTVVATDEFGRLDPTPATYTWRVDVTAPDTEITGAPDALTNQDFAAFTFTSTEAGSTFECRLDSSAPGDWVDCGDIQPEQYTGLGDGSHTFEVRAIDEAGNVDGSPDSHTWTVDTQAPDTNITDQPGDPSNVNNPSFQFDSTEGGSSFECRLDSSNPADFEPCTSGWQYSALTQGSHTFEVRATDPAGNTDGSPDSYTWFVDLTAPDTSINSGPDDPTNETLASFGFDGSDDHSAAGDLDFECRLDSTDPGDFVPCDSPEDFSGLSEGEHKLELRAIDEAGNPDPSPAVYEWTVDLTAPDALITDAPADPTGSADAHFEFSSEAGASFECRLDSTDPGDFAACDSPEDFTGLAEGPHTFEVRAIDAAGNVGPAEMHSWVIDTTGPDTTLTVTPPDPSNDTSPSLEFTGADPGGSGVGGFECQLDGGGFGPCSSPHALSGLGDGSHTFQVRAVDNAGNRDGSPASHTWTVDTDVPETTIDPPTPADPSNSTSAAFDFSSDEPGSFECRLDGGSFTACSPTQTYTGLAPGSHSLQVRAVDDAGNVDPTPAEFGWEIDLDEPQTSFSGTPSDPSGDAGPAFEFDSDEPGSSFECQLDGGGFGPCSSPHALSGLGDGSHTFQVRATDPAGNTDSTPASYTWLVDTTKPDTTLTVTPPDPSNDTSPSFEFTGADPGGSGVGGFECQLDGGGFGPCSSPQDYASVTAEGPHSFEVRAIDQAGNADATPASYTWTLDTTAPSVSVDSGPDDPTNSSVGGATFSVGDSATWTCELDGSPDPSGLCPSLAVPFTGLADGPHTFKVTGTDAAGNSASDTWTWTVDTAAPETTIEARPADGSPPSVNFEFSSSESPATYECSLDGAAFVACEPPENYAGLAPGGHTFAVRSKDAAGNTDPTPATHAWTVAQQAVLGGKPPVIKRRIRTLNVPLAGAFQIATVTCRDGSCRIDRSSATIKVGGKTYAGGISVEVVAKQSRTTLDKGEVARVVVRFPAVVQRRLVASHFGQLVVKVAASTDAGGASTFKKIKLKAKYLKELFK